MSTVPKVGNISKSREIASGSNVPWYDNAFKMVKVIILVIMVGCEVGTVDGIDTG